jgi:hypothetical protein
MRGWDGEGIFGKRISGIGGMWISWRHILAWRRYIRVTECTYAEGILVLESHTQS